MYITEKKLLKWALLCNAIYVLLFVIFRPQGINVLKIGITSILLLSITFIFLIVVKNKKQLQEIPKLSKHIFYLLIIWGCVVILRSLSLSLQDTVTNFGNVYMGWAWLVPMALVIGIKIENWSIVLNVIGFIFKLMIVVFIISLFFDNDYLKWAWLLRPVNLVLLMGLYRFTFLKKINIFIIVGILIIVATKVEQRMDLLFLGMTISLLLIDKIISIKIRRVLLKYIIGAFILVFTLVFTVGYEFVSNIISSIIDFQDSRTFLFKELFSELNQTEKFFGRGSLGTYYSEFFEGTRKYWELMGRTGWAGDVPERITIEVGYLQMLLKGGLVLLILNVSMYIYAIYLALFKSNNKFIKRLGYYILIITALSLVSLRPAFTPTFILLWLSIGTVLSKKNRQLSNEEINALIKFK